VRAGVSDYVLIASTLCKTHGRHICAEKYTAINENAARGKAKTLIMIGFAASC
jgi:hypothetical protein